MPTTSPFPFLSDAFDQLAKRLSPPAWAVQAAQQRLVLLLNHVLQQEPEAMARLQRQKGSVARVQWREFTLHLRATPAGLLDLADAGATPDLALTLAQTSPLTLAQQALRGEKPEVRIDGDVQLAAEVNWLVEHVRWDLEEDLARLIGDVPAHGLSEFARAVATALRAFVAAAPGTWSALRKNGP